MRIFLSSLSLAETCFHESSDGAKKTKNALNNKIGKEAKRKEYSKPQNKNNKQNPKRWCGEKKKRCKLRFEKEKDLKRKNFGGNCTYKNQWCGENFLIFSVYKHIHTMQFLSSAFETAQRKKKERNGLSHSNRKKQKVELAVLLRRSFFYRTSDHCSSFSGKSVNYYHHHFLLLLILLVLLLHFLDMRFSMPIVVLHFLLILKFWFLLFFKIKEGFSCSALLSSLSF